VETLELRACPAALSIADIALPEGTASSPLARFVISLSEKSTTSVAVNWATFDGTATVSDNDYRSSAGTVLFLPGQTSKTISVYVRGDATVEADETFGVRLSGAVGATLGRAEATATILNDDAPPQAAPILSIGDVAILERNRGRSEARFAVTLSAAAATPVSVRCTTSNGSATAADGDYLAASAKLVFAPGELRKEFAVSVLGDTRIETDETFTVSLSSAVGATISADRRTGTATIRNDDDPPSTPAVVSVAGVDVVEGNGGTDAAMFAAFTIKLSQAADKVVTVAYRTFDGTATVLDRDYVATQGNAVFPVGTTSTTVMVPIVGDVKRESDETFSLGLLSAEAASLGQFLATVTILDDDTPPGVSVVGGSVAEGNSGTTSLPFTISLSKAWTQPVTVTYETRDGTATVADGDYTATTGSVTFQPGQTEKTINVTVVGDTRAEVDETVALVLTSADKALLFASRGTGVIRNDDSGEVPGFQITVNYLGDVRQSIRDACDWAAARWSQVIIGDLPGVMDTARNVLIDDLRITVQEGLLDGGDAPGGTLANAGPTQFRQGALGLPWDAEAGIDRNDANNPQLRNIVLHEFGHALGFGVSGGGAPRFYSQYVVGDGFSGPNAVRAYNNVFRNADRSVPLETGGGPGTAGAHWRESVLRTELMTGYAESAGVAMPLSVITVGAMQDMGYTVSAAAADPFTPSILAAAASSATALSAPVAGVRSGSRSVAGRTVWAAIGRNDRASASAVHPPVSPAVRQVGIVTTKSAATPPSARERTFGAIARRAESGADRPISATVSASVSG